MPRVGRVPAAAAALALAAGSAARAEVLLARNQALERAFPEATEIVARDRFLTGDQVRAYVEQVGERPGSRLVTLYEAFDGERSLGWGVFDTRPVRTLEGTFLVSLGGEGTVRGVLVCAFHEPRAYVPRARWLARVVGLEAPEHARLDGGIDGISGATMSARAVARSVRRALALHGILVSRSSSD